MLSALQGEDVKQLGYGSSLQECLTAHVKGAPPGIALFVERLPYKEIQTTLNAGTCITTAFKSIYTPVKMTPINSSTSVAIPATPAANNPSDLADRVGIAPSTSASEVLGRKTDEEKDVMKQLVDSAKLSNSAGPLIPFLRGIVQAQSSSFLAHIEVDGDDHPIYKAIAICDIRAFREELETLFNKTYPISMRKNHLAREIEKMVYDEQQSLLAFRSTIIKLRKKAGELLDGPVWDHHKTVIIEDIAIKAMTIINNIKDYTIRSEVTLKFAGKSNVMLDDIIPALQIVDDALRARQGSNYPPPPPKQDIPVHAAIEAKTEICPACKSRWNKSWNHNLATCIGNPGKSGSAQWTAKWDERYIASGKQPGIFKGVWPTSVDTRNPNTRSSPNASNKRSSDGPRSSTPPVKKERSI
jgi:hypothetical protein